MKSKIFVLSLILAVTLCSCSAPQSTAPTTQTSSTKSTTTSESAVATTNSTIKTIKLSENASVIPLDFSSNSSILGFYNNNLLFTNSTINKDDSTNYTYLNYNILSEKTVEMGEVKNAFYFSDNYIIMNDKMYLTNKGDELLEFSLIKSQQKTLEKLNFNSPYQYFEKLNEQEFIFYGYDIEIDEEDTRIHHYIKKYNIKSNKLTNLFKGKAFDTIVSLFLKDNNIYLISDKEYKGQFKFKLEIYNTSGKLLKTTSTDHLAESLSKSDLKTYFKNDVLITEYISNKSFFIYKINSDETLRINTSEDLKDYKILSNNLNNDDYFYFINLSSKTLKVYDTKNFKFTTISIKTDDKFKYLSTCAVDEKGNIVLSAQSTEFGDNADCRVYLIKKENLIK